MKILVFFAISLLVKIELISSEKDCWFFDFNDPTVFSDFTQCYDKGQETNLERWVLKKYNASVDPTPIRSTSSYYLTSPEYKHNNAYRCSASKKFTLPARRNLIMEMALNINMSVNTNNLLVLELYSVELHEYLHIYTRSHGRLVYNVKIETKNFTVPAWDGDFLLQIYGNSWLSLAKRENPGDFVGIEYIMIYDPLTRDNNSCIDYHAPKVPEQSFCSAFDFNQPSSSQVLSDFVSCEDEQLPPLTIKSYENSTISPHRESATFYLSSHTEGMSCLQLSKVFTLDTNSRISSAIYLNNLWPGAWVEIYVYDKVTGDRQVVLSVESSSKEWRSLVGSVNRKFDNGQIFIQTNAHVHNSLAIEFLNITRTDDKCSKE